MSRRLSQPRPRRYALLAILAASIVLCGVSLVPSAFRNFGAHEQGVWADKPTSDDQEEREANRVLAVLIPILFSLGILGFSTTATVLLYDFAVRSLAQRRLDATMVAADGVVTEQSALRPSANPHMTSGAPSTVPSSYGTVNSTYFDEHVLAESGWAPVLAIGAAARKASQSSTSVASVFGSSTGGSTVTAGTASSSGRRLSSASEATIGVSAVNAERV